MKLQHIFLVIAMASVTITGCRKKEGCMDSAASNYNSEAEKDDGSCLYNTVDQQGTVKLHFHPMVGSQDLVYNTIYMDTSGRKFTISKAQFYLSGVNLKTENGEAVTPNAGPYLLVHAGQMMYDLGDFDAEHYHGLGFDVGVDAATNTGVDPASWASGHPLSSDNSNYAYWSWSSGYQFIKIEGLVDTTSDQSGTPNFAYEMHVGTAAMLRPVSLSTHMDVGSGETKTITIMVDYQKVYNGIDMRINNTTHTMDNMPLATKVADNLSSAFVVQ